ncbi:acetyltransferase [Roseibium aquae]|uniref:Acetyltransferase n=2 Tax=Roseibium aquae TaxID=1323746 RepID=A0A916WV68_9HYPH|nr:acetyltransferase [Roseibium aquae]
MNTAAVPAVNDLTEDALHQLIRQSLACPVAIAQDRPVGFLLCLAEGLAYDSRNYRHLGQMRARFAYTDRICVDDSMRNQKVGEKLYQAVFQTVDPTGRSLVCEVNTRPPNPGSLRFHKRLGFTEIGEADHGDKAVVYLERPAVLGEAQA